MTTLSEDTAEIGNLKVTPLIVGGMGVDISTAALALEISRLGGVGHISDAMSPFISDRVHGTRFQAEKEKRFHHLKDSLDKTGITWDPEEVYIAQRNHVGSTMNQKKGDGAIFLNVMEKLTMGLPKETLRARLRGALDAEIDGITLSAGLHLGTLALMADHPRFRDAAIGIIVSSVRALKVFMRSAEKVKRLPDYIIVEGPLAGGHLGFDMNWREHNLKDIVIEVMGYLRENELSIPVVPAGGVFTCEDARAFLELGATAVQVATRFTISRECGLPKLVKQKYITATEEDVVVNLTSPTGYPMRMLSSSPSMRSNIKPNCEALGYVLDGQGRCAYHQAYEAAGIDEKGKKLPVTDKMCICYHFMKYQCYTCGHNVHRLKDTTYKQPDGNYYLPRAEEIFRSYVYNNDVRAEREESVEFAVSV